jgi:hypothetical protein
MLGELIDVRTWSAAATAAMSSVGETATHPQILFADERLVWR